MCIYITARPYTLISLTLSLVFFLTEGVMWWGYILPGVWNPLAVMFHVWVILLALTGTYPAIHSYQTEPKPLATLALTLNLLTLLYLATTLPPKVLWTL